MSVSRPRCKSKRHISEQDTVEQGGLFANTLPLVFRPHSTIPAARNWVLGGCSAQPDISLTENRSLILESNKAPCQASSKVMELCRVQVQHFLTSNTVSHLIPTDQAISGLGNNTSLSTTMIWRMRPQRRDMEAISVGHLRASNLFTAKQAHLLPLQTASAKATAEDMTISWPKRANSSFTT